MDVRIIRIFNTYGPKMNSADGRAIPEFINKALKSESIETVSYTHLRISDFCRA